MQELLVFYQSSFTKHWLKWTLALELMGKPSHQCALPNESRPLLLDQSRNPTWPQHKPCSVTGISRCFGEQELMKCPSLCRGCNPYLLEEYVPWCWSHKGVLGCLWEPLDARASSDVCLFEFHTCQGPNRKVSANRIVLMQMFIASRK